MDLEFTTPAPTHQHQVETSEANANSSVKELQDLVLTEDHTGKGFFSFLKKLPKFIAYKHCSQK